MGLSLVLLIAKLLEVVAAVVGQQECLEAVAEGNSQLVKRRLCVSLDFLVHPL
jgi:hypothetical protein